ncbi:MAG: tRNA-specific adenosine deaminase [Desulfobulbus sp.]|nr:MAG: tRNA-specific adenosine deaminase [Desulfobulbus sp.]
MTEQDFYDTAQDYIFMGNALECAADAASMGEVPVGAVLVDAHGTIIASAGNDCISSVDPTGHAEILVLRASAKKHGNYRLPCTTMYVTLEPCAMCATAMIQARVKRIVFGARDPKAGGLQSVYQIGTDGLLNHRFLVTGGVREDECGQILKDFFKSRR